MSDRLFDGGQGPRVPGAIADGRGARLGENNGGGPRTADGLAKVSQNLVPGQNVRHGVYPFLERNTPPRCAGCIFADECPEFAAEASCRYLAEFMGQMEDAIMALDYIRPEDILLVRRLVKAAGLVEMIDAYISKRGVFVGSGSELKLQPSLERIKVSQEHLILRTAEQLGLSPRSRASLKLVEERGPLAALQAAFLALETRGSGDEDRDGNTVDGEFTMDFDGDGDREDGGETAQQDFQYYQDDGGDGIDGGTALDGR